MGFLLVTFVLALVIVGVWQAVRPRELAAHTDAVLEDADGAPLPEPFVEPLGDTCVGVTASALEVLAELDEAEEKLAKGDGHAQEEAREHLIRAVAMAEEIGALATQAIDELPGLPEEPGWWLGHVVEGVEAVGTLDEHAERLADGVANAVTRGAVRKAIERVEELLLGARDFSERQLGFDLPGWVREEQGREAGRRFERATKGALARLA